MGEPGDDRGGERPGGSGFDAVAGVRALAEVQRRGLLAAGELVDRLVRTVDGSDGDAPDGRSNGAGATSEEAAAARRAASPLGGTLDDVVQLWLQLARLGVDVIGQAAGSNVGAATVEGSQPGATVDVGTQRASGSLRLAVPAGDAPASDPPRAEIWLHNGTSDAHAGIELHSGDLRSHDGTVLAATALRFDPPVVDLPARSSRGITVSVTLHTDPPAGIYRGVVQATRVPEAWLPVEVTIT